MKRSFWVILGVTIALSLGLYKVSENILLLGDGSAGDKKIVANIGDGATNPVMRFNNSKSRWDFSNDGTVYKSIGSGTGGLVTVIEEPGFEDGTIGAAVTYKDAAGSAPVDADGGTAATVSVAINTATPILGENSLRISHAATDGRGEGVAIPFTVPTALMAKALSISFYYKASVDFSFANNDMTIYIVDDDTGEVIQPSTYFLNGSGSFQATWQTHATSDEYRIAFHSATAAALLYTIDIDHLVIGQQSVTNQSVDTDWIDFDPTLQTTDGNINIAYTDQVGSWRREGASIHVIGWIRVGTVTSPGTGTYYTPLPNGLTPVFGRGAAGSASVFDSPNTYTGSTILDSSDSAGLGIVFRINGWALGSSGIVGQNLPAANWLSNVDRIHFDYIVPVTGWGSNTVVSSQNDGRRVAARFTATSGTISGTGGTVIDYSNKIHDSHSAISGTGSNWKFTAPISDYYSIGAATLLESATWGAGDLFEFYLKKNGSTTMGYFNRFDMQAAYTDLFGSNGYLTVFLNAGDYVQVLAAEGRTAGDVTINSFAGYTYIDILSGGGGQTIAASEVFVERASTVTAGSYADLATLQFDVIDFSTHGAWSTATSTLTAVISGYYNICPTVTFTNSDTGGAEYIEIYIVPTGGLTLRVARKDGLDSATQALSGCGLVQLDAGETASVRVRHLNSVGLTLSTSSNVNKVMIHRIGGVM